MEKVNNLIKSINEFVAKAGSIDELREVLQDHPNRDLIVDAVEDYESIIAKLLRGQQKDLVDAINRYTEGGSTENPVISAMLDMIMEDVARDDDFDVQMSAASRAFLTSTVANMTSALMEMIDKDVAFNILSDRTLKWIDNWSDDLGTLMKLTSHNKVGDIIRQGIQDGKSIQDIELELMESEGFSRNRARRTAITEVLTANSVSQHEAYAQSPAVVGKTWHHSGPRGIRPRPAHVALSGTTIPLNENFNVNGFTAKHPRDTNLPASERVNCHCYLSPEVDEAIFGLSREEKNRIRNEAMKDMEVDW